MYCAMSGKDVETRGSAAPHATHIPNQHHHMRCNHPVCFS